MDKNSAVVLEVIKALGDPDGFDVTIQFHELEWVGAELGDRGYNNEFVLNPRFTVGADCSDVFETACSDVEEVTEENIALFIQTLNELRSIEDQVQRIGDGDDRDWAATSYVTSLFAARVRRMRPLDAYRSQAGRRVAALLADAGPSRVISVAGMAPDGAAYRPG